VQKRYGEFGVVNRKLQGLLGEFQFGDTEGYIALANAKGKFNSNAFNGQQSGIVVTGFTSSQLTAKKAFATTDVEVTKTINFPNPGGPNYLQKSGAPAKTVTTIVLNLTRSAKKIELALYDITGILIKEVPQSSIKANGSATQTNKFVYEYDWDGTNGENESVASGVYLYRFKIDDSIVKTGKLVLIR